MIWICSIFSVICGYFVGAVNPAILLSKCVYHEDIRNHGSGNPGFTNFKRVYGNNPISWSVLLLDIAKTAVPVYLFALSFEKQFDMWQFGAALCGFACMLGHCFPVWYGFKGGKSFIAGITTIWVVDWRVGLICTAVFLLILFVFKYMSLAAITALGMYPIILAIVGVSSWETEAIAVLSALLVIWRHKANIKRLFNGTEAKFNLHK